METTLRAFKSSSMHLKLDSVMKSVKDIAKGHFTEMPRRAQQSMHRLALRQLPRLQWKSLCHNGVSLFPSFALANT